MEIWKQIKDWPNYEVSSYGFVRRIGGWYIRLHFNSKGYLRADLSRNGVVKHVSVALLVAETFNGPRPKGLTTNHKDGNKLNNRPDNLGYLTRLENQRYSVEILGRPHMGALTMSRYPPHGPGNYAHGTLNCYYRNKCRCRPCADKVRERSQVRRDRRSQRHNSTQSSSAPQGV